MDNTIGWGVNSEQSLTTTSGIHVLYERRQIRLGNGDFGTIQHNHERQRYVSENPNDEVIIGGVCFDCLLRTVAELQQEVRDVKLFFIRDVLADKLDEQKLWLIIRAYIY